MLFFFFSFFCIFVLCNISSLDKSIRDICNKSKRTIFIYLFIYTSLSLVPENSCDALRDLVSFVQFKKREKHQPATLLKITLFHGRFSCFLNCTNGTKSCNASHLQF